MKKIKLIIVLSFVLILCGCREYGDKRIVKLVTVDKENVTLYYYDYSGDKPSYLTEQQPNNGVENTLIQMLAQQDYNLKLCKYVICDKETLQTEMQNLFWSLINSKFSPDVEIIQGDTKEKAERYAELKNECHPIYSYTINGKSVTGIVEAVDDGLKNIIVNSQLYKTIDKKESFVFDILNGNTDKGNYTFAEKGKKLSAQFENVSFFYSVDKNTLNISMFANLKSYKGMPANKESKDEFIKIAEKNIYKDIETLIEDDVIAENFNLLWYRNVENFNKIKINIEIK